MLFWPHFMSAILSKKGHKTQNNWGTTPNVSTSDKDNIY